MNYFLAYLALGVLTLIGVGIDTYIRRRNGAADWSQISKTIRRTNQPWPEKIVERVVLPVIAGMAIIIAWPFALAFAVYFYQRRNRDEQRPIPIEPDHFTVKPSDLAKRLTIEEIELREVVRDPLQAVPDVPFGHLHLAWLDFRRKIEAGDEIWLFEAQWGNYLHPTTLRRGYATVRQGMVVAVFVAKASPVTLSA